MTENYLKIGIEARLSDGKAHTAEDLAWYCLLKETNDTYPKTRAIIREMINEGALIGSTSVGYKLMTTGKEVQQCLNALLKRTMGINKRIQGIYDAAQAKGIL
jgi:hypothetical protein